METVLIWLLPLVLAYLIGSLPLGAWLVRAASGFDPRDVNPHLLGVENVYKLVGPVVAVSSFVLDILKGLVAVMVPVLITSWSTKPFDPVMLQGARLRLAVHSAGTIRGLFPKSVLEHGLRIAQGGSAAMALPVAEMALTMTLALLRNLHTHDRAMQASRDWAEARVAIHGGLFRTPSDRTPTRVPLK